MFELDREFELEQAVDCWCRSLGLSRWKSASRRAELKDHLYCAIEQLTAEGLSEEQAFVAATERMGNAEELRLEYSKNRGLAATVADILSVIFLPGGTDMSKAKPLLPTITMAIGILLGGVLGAVAGLFAGSEAAVIVCYVVGFLGGAVVGGMLGWKLHARNLQRVESE